MGKERGGRGWLCSRAALGSTAHEKSPPLHSTKEKGGSLLLVGMEFDKTSTAHEIIWKYASISWRIWVQKEVGLFAAWKTGWEAAEEDEVAFILVRVRDRQPSSPAAPEKEEKWQEVPSLAYPPKEPLCQKRSRPHPPEIPKNSAKRRFLTRQRKDSSFPFLNGADGYRNQTLRNNFSSS